MRLWCGQYRPVDRATVVECSGLAYRSSTNSLGDKPATEDREDVRLLFGCQGMPFGDRVPFLQAATAAGCGAVLSDEDRVVPHRGLLAVIRWIGGGETLLDELLPVRHHGVQPLALQVFPFSGTEAESATEGERASLSKTSSRSLFIVRSPLHQALLTELAHVVPSPSLDSPAIQASVSCEPAPREVRHKEPSRW